MQEIVFNTRLLEDGHLYCPDKYAKPKAMYKVIVSLPDEEVTSSRRPFGLCKGEFLVPDDFDDPLPEKILGEFEGQ